MVWGRRQ